jgi:hypothetical protein
MSLRSSLFDKVRYESATAATGSGTDTAREAPGAEESLLIASQEPGKRVVVEESAEKIYVRDESRPGVQYRNKVMLREGEGPARLPVLLVRIEREGRELELTLPVLQRINLDHARITLQAMDQQNAGRTPRPAGQRRGPGSGADSDDSSSSSVTLTTNVSAVLNLYSVRVLLAPWRLNQIPSVADEDWKVAQWDRVPAP